VQAVLEGLPLHFQDNQGLEVVGDFRVVGDGVLMIMGIL
jgi:hypothetical protein